MSAREPLSVFVTTLDNAATLAACLESVAFADEIVVLDSGSKDGTEAIARGAGAKWWRSMPEPLTIWVSRSRPTRRSLRKSFSSSPFWKITTSERFRAIRYKNEATARLMIRLSSRPPVKA